MQFFFTHANFMDLFCVSRLIKSYLGDRFQSILIVENVLDFVSRCSGVPQGSVLGPSGIFIVQGFLLEVSGRPPSMPLKGLKAAVIWNCSNEDIRCINEDCPVIFKIGSEHF